MADIKYPDYPCVALQGLTRQTNYVNGEKKEKIAEEIMFYPIGGQDDLSHVDQMRRFKGFAVVGFANLNQILDRAPYKKNEVKTLHEQLDALVAPPELKRKMAEMEAREKELEAKFAALAAQSNAAAQENSESPAKPARASRHKQVEVPHVESN